MLSLLPPYLEVKDLIIFRDDKETDQFYYAVVRPRIVRTAEGPRLAAYALLPESGLTGEVDDVLDAGLSLEVGLVALPESLEAAREAIKKHWGRERCRLAPAPVTDGKVYLTLADAGEEPDPANWFVSSTVAPSMFGDNVAALVVKAGGADAKRLIAALDGEVVAGSVFYELSLLGLTPAFNARMHIDWRQVYHHFESFESKNFIFFKDEVHESVDRLRESGAVVVEMEQLDPDTQEFALKNMMEELRRQMVERLFQPAVGPLSASQKWEDRLLSGISRFASSLLPGVHYQLRQVDESQLRTMTVDLHEARVKKVPFHPQALLSSLIRENGDWRGHLKWLRLDELPFRSDLVDVALAADTFATANIKSVRLECRVSDEESGAPVTEMTFVFEPDTPLKRQFNFIRRRDGRYRYQHRATIFLEEENSVLPGRLETDWQEAPSPYLYFNAADYFESRELLLDVDDTSLFDHAPLVETNVHICRRETGEPVLQRTFMYTRETADKQVLALIVPQDLPLQTDVEIRYYLPQSRDFVQRLDDWSDPVLFIPNPFENRWSVDLVSAADWERTLRMIVEVRVWEETRGDYIYEKVTLSREQPQATFGCATDHRTPRGEVEVRITVIRQDATIGRGAWQRHPGPVIALSDVVKPERTIRARLREAPDFEALDIKKVTIEFNYEDPENGIDLQSDHLPWDKVGDVVEFTHPLPNFNALEYEYRVQAYSRRGDRYRTIWQKAIQDELDIVLPEELW